AERSQVTNRIRIRQSLLQAVHRTGDVCSRGATLDPLFEKRHLTGEVSVLALEVGQSFFRGAVGKLSALPLGLAVANINSSRLVDAAPRFLDVSALIVGSHSLIIPRRRW